jgi:hypothetical protein
VKAPRFFLVLKEHLYLEISPLRVEGAAVFPYSEALYKRFEAKDRFGETYNYARRVGEFLLVPRELARLRPLDGDFSTFGTKVFFGISSTNSPRSEEQQRVLKESFRLLRQGYSHIIEGSTGFGKTYIGLTLSGLLSLKTLVVVQKQDLLEQWKRDALKFLNIAESDIGIIQQDRCEVANKKLVFGMVQSLCKEKYSPEIYREFGLVIFDEVHHMAADKFSIAAGLFHARLRLGLTATAARVDGREGLFEAHIGEVMVRTKVIPLPPKVLVLSSPWNIPRVPRKINGSWRTVPLPHEHGKLGAVLLDIAACALRNALIAKAVSLAFLKGRYTLVLSDLARDKHLDALYKAIVDAGVPASEIGYYVGGMRQDALERAKAKHVVLATYQMAGEATDVPWWSTAVLATPRANVQQAVGRILRPYDGKPEPVVFDIVDDGSPVLQDYYHKRLKTYFLLGGRVVRGSLD